jgi:hypothetical protein
VLKRRLERRLAAVGITVTQVHEEEWSYIPVGGPMPLQDQTITAFGAAANLVHPATGFSVTRSLREAPKLAEQIQQVCARAGAGAGDGMGLGLRLAPGLGRRGWGAGAGAGPARCCPAGAGAVLGRCRGKQRTSVAGRGGPEAALGWQLRA